MIVSDTGPLISAFQSGSFPLLHALLGDVVVPKAVADEIAQHGWSNELAAVGEKIRVVELAPDEQTKVAEVADAIGTSGSLEHRGEA
jgi:predicted nucleic acid-binding protein